jgi:hypothetical protein
MFHLKVIKNLLLSETINNIIFTKSSTDLQKTLTFKGNYK